MTKSFYGLLCAACVWACAETQPAQTGVAVDVASAQPANAPAWITVQNAPLIPPRKPLGTADYKALIAAYEGEWRGEIRASATEESQVSYAERAAIEGRVIPARAAYVLKKDADGRWELAVESSYGEGARTVSVTGRVYLEDGVLRSDLRDSSGKTASYIGAVNGDRVEWTAEAIGESSRNVEWVEADKSSPCLRTQTFQTLRGKNGPVYVRLDGYLYKKDKRPARMETFERASSLLNAPGGAASSR